MTYSRSRPDGYCRQSTRRFKSQPVYLKQTLVKSGRSAAQLTTGRTRGHVSIDKRLPTKRFAGKTITLGTWLHASVKNVAGLQILDFIQGNHEISVSEAHPGDEQWHFLSVTRTIRPEATGQVVFRLSVHVPFVKRPEESRERV